MDNLEKILGYEFKDKSLLKTAFTHKSVKGRENNQKLEFLGDSILGFVLADLIYSEFPELTEGEMTKLRSSAVCKNALSSAVERLGIFKYVALGKNEARLGVQNSISVKEDLYEAVVAAVYLDGGLDAARDFIKSTLMSIIKASAYGDNTDYKSKINEFVGKHNLQVRFTDEPSDIGFYCRLYIEGDFMGEGEGKSKKIAEQSASKAALEKLKD